MDQLRTALVWLKRHHFWVLCGLVALISLGCWAKASGKMSTLFKTGETAIKSEFNNVAGVRKEPFHANDDVNAKQEAQTTQQAADVANLWKQLYNRQREHVLEWPPELSKEFRDYVEKLQFGDPIRDDMRNQYFNYIENHFPALPKQIDARPIDPSVAAGSAPGAEFGRGRFTAETPGSVGTELLDEGNYVCEWSAADQALVRDELNFRDQPSALEIWVTQENLWVYHTLLDVIKNTNRAAKSTRISNAAVQQIGELAVGLRAGKASYTSGRLWVKPAVAAAGPAGPEGAPPGVPGGPMPPGGMGPEGGLGMQPGFSPQGGPNGGPMTEEQKKTFLLSGRYLGADGKPIPFGAGGAAPAGPEAPVPATDPAAASQPIDLTAFGQEYKRLPVRMSLRMDQRWLPRLISECASQPLQIEVQEVRINPPEGLGAGAGGPGMGRPGDSGVGGNASVFGEEPAIQPFPNQPEMVNVIIQGTIYIFNKPNPTILQTPGEQPAGAQPAPNTAAAQ